MKKNATSTTQKPRLLRENSAVRLSNAVKLERKSESILIDSMYITRAGKAKSNLIKSIIKKDTEKFFNKSIPNWYGKIACDDGKIEFFYMVSRKKGVCTVSISYFLPIDEKQKDTVVVKRFVTVFMYADGFTTMSGFRTWNEEVTDTRHVVPCFTMSNKTIED